MKHSIRKKVFILTATMSIILIVASIAVSSIIFIVKNTDDATDNCKSVSNTIGKMLMEDYNDFIGDCRRKMETIYRDNRKEISDFMSNEEYSQSEVTDFFSNLVAPLFPPKNAFGVSYEILNFNINYEDVTLHLDLAATMSDMRSFICFYDDENESIVYLLDSSPVTAYYHHYACSFDKVTELFKNSVVGKTQTVVLFEKDFYNAYTPLFNDKGELVAYVAFQYSNDALMKIIGNFTSLLIATMLVATIIILIVYLLLSEKYIVKNIRQLSDATAEFSSIMSEGKNLHTVDANIKTKDELGMLSQNFSNLQTKIIEYVKDLEVKTANEESMRTELNIASKIQMQSLPNKPLFSDTFSISSFIKPAKEVGGDLFDYFMIDESKMFFVLADVTGKGVPAALFMMRGKEIISSCAKSGMCVSKIAETVNNELCQNKEGLFITAFLGIFDTRTNTLQYVRAGHEQPYLVHNGTAEKICEESNFVLGGFKNFKYIEDTMVLEEGDKLLLYTDGLNEGINSTKEEFGYDRIKETIETSKGNIMTSLYNSLKEFSGDTEQFDDVTMLLLERAETKQVLLTNPGYEDIPKTVNEINTILTSQDSDKVSEVGIIIDELMNNYISYSYSSQNSPILEVKASVVNHLLTLSFTDNGTPFNPIESKDADTNQDLAERKIGGLGIMIVKSLTNTMQYQSYQDKNVLTITKTMLS